MKTLMFYSYKGGSGRTVAAANVAAAFAKLGRRTAIIDLDFEAPGLHHVFGLKDRSVGIQSYLKADIELDELIRDATIDVVASKKPLERPRLPDGGELLYVLASPGVTLLDASDPDVNDRMKSLRKNFEDGGTEILVIDAASGVREAYAIAYDVCDEMVIFFRWSKQHVAGTLKTAEYLKGLRRMSPKLSRPFVLVASASPGQQEIDAVTDERLRADLTLIKEDTQAVIRKKLAECEATPGDVFFEIPELLEMKWRESLVVFANDDTPYEKLAEKLLTHLGM
jgi:MinD-like ATPase involved in chromosome partitioning or flagellar assembly